METRFGPCRVAPDCKPLPRKRKCQSGRCLKSRLASVDLERREKRAQRLTFLDPETARWGGGLPRERVVAEKFVPSLESLSSLRSEERNLGILPGCPGPLGVFKKFVQKKSVRKISPPKLRE